jgi:hypothetical protein
MRWSIRHRSALLAVVFLLTAAAGLRAQPGRTIPVPLLEVEEDIDTVFTDADPAYLSDARSTAVQYRLSSSLYETWDADSLRWYPTHRTVNGYDPAGRRSLSSYQQWNYPGWLTYRQEGFTYDNEGRLVQVFDDALEGSSLVPSSREQRTYDEQGKVVGFRTEVWQESLWVNASWDVRSYDVGAAAETTVSHLWADTGWATWDRNIRWLDDAGRVVMRIRQRRSGGAFVDANKYIYVYDAHGNRTLTQSYTSDYVQWTLRKATRDSLTYDPDGKLVERFRVTGIDSPWTFTSCWSYTYDASGFLVHTLSRGLVPKNHIEPIEYVWAARAEDLWTVDASGNLTSRLNRVWHDTDWVNSARQTNEWEVFLLAVSDEPGVAGGFRLEGNYPNPFNPSTTISYVLPAALPVRLALYDLLGRTVAVLVDAPQEAGPHHEWWSAAGAASGVYVYRLSAGTQTTTGKMLLLR